jgi:hypothetical protein
VGAGGGVAAGGVAAGAGVVAGGAAVVDELAHDAAPSAPAASATATHAPALN